MQPFPLRCSLNRVAAIALIGASAMGCSDFKSGTPSLTAPAVQTTQPPTPPQSSNGVPKPASAAAAAQPEHPGVMQNTTAATIPPAPTPKLAQPTPKKPLEPTAKQSALAATASAAAPEVSATPPALDFKSMEQRLRDTRAIGMMTKLSLKNQFDDLIDAFRDFYAGKVNTPLLVLRQRFDLLVMKVLAVLQDGDAALASAIASSREFIWGILRDPKKFADIAA